MTDQIPLEIYWCPTIFLTLAVQTMALTLPSWYRVTWNQHGIVRTQRAGLFSTFDDADYIVLCGGMEGVCQDIDPNSTTSYKYDIARTLLLAGDIVLLLGFMVAVPRCWNAIGGHYLVLGRICGYSAFLTLMGCAWCYILFYSTTSFDRMSFVSLQLGSSFFLTLFTGCVTFVIACALYTLSSIKPIMTSSKRTTI